MWSIWIQRTSQFCLFLNGSPGEAPRLLSEVQEVFVFAYISQRQVFPERDPAGQADATCISCLKKLALGCMLVFLESSSGWELPQAFKVLMASSSVFAGPSANHSQIQNQHWSAPFNMLNLISIRILSHIPRKLKRQVITEATFMSICMWWENWILLFPALMEGIASNRQKKPQSPLSSASVLKPEQLSSLALCWEYVCCCSYPFLSRFCHPWCDSIIVQTAWSSIRECFWFEILCLEFIYFPIWNTFFSDLAVIVVPNTCFSLLLSHL